MQHLKGTWDLAKGFTRDGKFHPITSRKKRMPSKDMLTPTGGVKVFHTSKYDNEGYRLKRYKKFVPRVTIKAHKNRGEKQVANYTVNLAGRGMYLVGTKKQALEHQEELRETVKHHLERGHGFTKDGYVIYPERKS